MSYEAQEGVDYLVDLYQLTTVPQDAPADEIRQALNARAREYHPDRLEGLAPEFKEKGARIMPLLTRARAILLDAEKRSEYDDILNAWEGPVSSDGVPVVRMDDLVRAELAMQTPDEIEAVFAGHRERVTAMVKHSPKRQARLARAFAAAEGEDADDIREEYDEALFAEDQVLAIEETQRGKLVGLPVNERHEASLGYAENVRLALQNAKVVEAEAYKRRALGGVATRLALLAGESSAAVETPATVPATSWLPHYFDSQAQRIAEVATQREALLKKRLDIFQPAYPLAELQTQAYPNFVVGFSADTDSDQYGWAAFTFDKEAVALSNVDMPEEIQQLLEARQFEQVYAHNYNMLTFAMKENIDPHTLLEEACNKHIRRYFPGVLG